MKIIDRVFKKPRNPDVFYKAVDADGLSFFPIVKADRVNWVELIGKNYALGDDEGWEKAQAQLADGESACCTKHLLHGYEDIELARDFGKRNGGSRGYRIIAFMGTPVARMEGSLLLVDKGAFPDAVKYGFRSVDVLYELNEGDSVSVL